MTLDQSYTQSQLSYHLIDSLYWGNEKFTAGLSGKLAEIDVYVAKSGSPTTDLNVALYSDSGGKPDSLLELTTIPKASIGSYAWQTAIFSNITPIVNGTIYHIVLSSGDSAGIYMWGVGGASIPPTMVAYWSVNSGSSWILESNQCYLFREYVNAIATNDKTINSDAKIQVTGIQKTINSDTLICQQRTINSDTKIKIIGIQDTINSGTYIVSLNQHIIDSDTKIKVLGNQQIINSDTYIHHQSSDTITSDAKIKVLANRHTMNSDTKIKVLGNQKTITSDAYMVIRNTKTIFSDTTIREILVLKLNNKISFLIQTIMKVNNYFSMFLSTVKKCNNKITTRAQGLYKCQNDFRILLPHQIIIPPVPPIPPVVPPNTPTPLPLPIYQSFGKIYIHVYINSIEQTDVDVDSITIGKELNNASTASLLLARPYDAVLPIIESLITITYNTWTLYRGYITSIIPTDNPECVRLECKDEMWKQNKTRVYFFVGHKSKTSPTAQTFYKTIQLALSALGIGAGFGNFIPQTINAWGKGKAEAITELITSAGNNNWFYDVNGSPVIETDGAGSVVSLEAQDFDTQLNLHQVLNQSFKYDASGVINLFRVQMGNFVDRGGNQQFAGGDFATFTFDVTPMWDASKEVLMDIAPSGHDWRYPPKNDHSWDDVYRKYQLYDLETDPTATNSALHWTDRYAPVVSIEPALFNYTNNVGNNTGEAEVLTEGYTIDYKNATITFNKPVYQYYTDEYGQPIGYKSARISVLMIAEYLFPQLNVNSPLSFDTPKMGDYPTTYRGDFTASGLNIQIGKFYMGDDKLLHYIPAWNDTDFARDLAMHQLSKICNEKINGTIDLTVDAVCTYGIDLSKQIVIPGIMETALNIRSIHYRLSDFQVTLQLDRGYNYQRSISLQSRGDDWF